jgi:hypothetical protein
MAVGTHTDFLVVAVVDELHLAGTNGTAGDIAGFRCRIGGGHDTTMLPRDLPYINRKVP